MLDNMDSNDVNPSREPIKVIVKNIERYLVDKTFVIKAADHVVDLFDLTLIAKKKQIKCALHPNLNKFIYKGLLKLSSVIKVNDYSLHIDETQVDSKESVIINDITFLTAESAVSNDEALSVFPIGYDKNIPLLTSRGYYLPQHTDEDTYGKIWNEKEIKLVQLDASILRVKELTIDSTKPIMGTVIAKSKLKHFGKVDDTKHKFPYLFSVELEDDSFSCGVSFWNTQCSRYFKRIHVGQHIVLKNYRVKRRYGCRSNTVFGVSKDTGMELSLNPPYGEVELLTSPGERIKYKFKTSHSLCKALPQDCIIDTAGIVCYIGRFEKEKKLSFNKPVSANDFWMFKWVCIRDRTCKKWSKLKIYSCSQGNVFEEISIGDILVATRMLYKLHCYISNGKQTLNSWLTTTKESQFTHLKKQWIWDEVKSLPFIDKQEVLDLLQLCQTDDVYQEILCGSYQGGYFTYPSLPDKFQNYQSLFSIEKPLEIISTENLHDIAQDLHIYQSRRVCVQANLVIVELVDEEENDEENEFIVLDEVTSALMDDLRTVGQLQVLTKERKTQILGNQDFQPFLRVTFVGLNKKIGIVGFIIPKTDPNSSANLIDVMVGHPVSVHALKQWFSGNELDISKDDKFLLVLDLYFESKNNLQVFVNRAYKL